MPDLPRELAEGVERLLVGVSGRELSRASAALSARYRARPERHGPVARTRPEILAYAATRLPATYAAISAALTAVRDLLPDWRPRSLLDLGAGPGSGLWSATTTWPSIERVVAVEAEPAMLHLGRELARSATRPAIRDAVWLHGSVAAPAPGGPFDLVLVAYVLGELDPVSRDRAIERAWETTAAPNGLAVVVEPGTPDGYRRVLRARELLLAGGGSVTAPCPHDGPCPLTGADWCHVAVRLPRTAVHRAAKGADLGYEDEKLSYVAVSRQPTARAAARVLRHPRVRPRVIELELCTTRGVEHAVITHSQREAFKAARKARWGDRFDVPAADETA